MKTEIDQKKKSMLKYLKKSSQRLKSHTCFMAFCSEYIKCDDCKKFTKEMFKREINFLKKELKNEN